MTHVAAGSEGIRMHGMGKVYLMTEGPALCSDVPMEGYK